MDRSYKCYMNRETNLFNSFINGNTYSNKVYCEYNNHNITESERIFMRNTLNGIYYRWKMYYDLEDKSTMYYKFRIPKASGGFRNITAPNEMPALMFTDIQVNIEHGFLTNQSISMNHDNAYAYIKTRWCKPAVEKHQQNNSEYFGHIDLSNFFGNSNPEFVFRMMKKVYPFCEFCSNKKDEELLKKVLDICFLDNGLPQGTQVSPILTNIFMIPFDCIFSNKLEDELTEGTMVYTRYADDIIVSSDKSFDINRIVELITEVFNILEAPYTINEDKTTYKRNKGRTNFILGIQLNQDNNMTIGRKRKRQIRFLLHNFFNHGEAWGKDDIASLCGQLNYFYCIEPEVYGLTMEYYNNKYNCDVLKALQEKLKV